MQFSTFGEKFNRYSGITQLMDDLNDGLRTPGAIMLGGGNPAAIPEMLDYFRLTTEEILFNLFAGKQPDGSFKKILLPLAPEYIGYGDAGIDEDIFVSYHPEIELLDNGLFKYHVDFEQLKIDDSVAAICASRPTNPTGNVLTEEEIHKLDQLARENNIPLLVDNAYGVPFPNIIFEDVEPFWNENTILCMSLSKLGLPGVRCGIVIANEQVTEALSNMNGIISLAPGSIGPALAHRITLAMV